MLGVCIRLTLPVLLSGSYLPPNSARIGYAAEGALFISAQQSSDAVSVLRTDWVLIRLWEQSSVEART